MVLPPVWGDGDPRLKDGDVFGLGVAHGVHPLLGFRTGGPQGEFVLADGIAHRFPP